MSAAVALSAALHVYLIYGFSLTPESSPRAGIGVIHAQLILPREFAGPQRAKTPGRLHMARLSPPAATVDLPRPPGEPAESAMAPTPASAAKTPDSTAAAGAGATRSALPYPVLYPAKDLDIYPQALTRIAPAYPAAARDGRLAGSVTLQVLIDETGRVVSTSVIDAAPEGIFEQAAQEALANAAFYPAQKDGRMVGSRILVKVEFDPATMLRDATP
jgi:TonB family protein